MRPSEIISTVLIFALSAVIGYLVSELKKVNRQYVSLLINDHERSMAAIASVAEHAIETVKAASLAEREQVRVQRQVNDVQVAQMRDIISKQANMIHRSPPMPEKVRLEDGSEVASDEYEWGI